jgi:hypothetical protein
VSNAHGWPSYTVDVEHLPDRSLRLWLRTGTSTTPLGDLDRFTGLYPAVKQRVAGQLELADPAFHVELRIPRPPYVRDGDRVVAVEDDGRRIEGIVRDWIGGEVLIDAVDTSWSGGGLYSPDEVTFPGDGGPPRT